jgi:hypothetical protein
MLADEVTTFGTYATVLLGSVLLFWIAIHAYAWWTIRNIDGTEE